MKNEKELDCENEKKFAKQWEGVVKNYPLVAIRFVQVLEAINHEQHRVSRFFENLYMETFNVCDGDSPFKLSDEFCKPGIPFDSTIFEECEEPKEYTQAAINKYLECVKSKAPSRKWAQ